MCVVTKLNKAIRNTFLAIIIRCHFVAAVFASAQLCSTPTATLSQQFSRAPSSAVHLLPLCCSSCHECPALQYTCCHFVVAVDASAKLCSTPTATLSQHFSRVPSSAVHLLPLCRSSFRECPALQYTCCHFVAAVLASAQLCHFVAAVVASAQLCSTPVAPLS